MKRLLACFVVAVVLAGVLSVTQVDAGENESFQKTLGVLPVLLEAVDEYDREESLLPGDTITYGALIQNGHLPESLCEKTISNGTCGSVSAENEILNVKAPPVTMFDTFALVRIIVPFWNIEDKHRRKLSRAVEDHSAIVATWDHPEGDIPVVLKETRKGALRRFVRFIRREETQLGSKMSI